MERKSKYFIFKAMFFIFITFKLTYINTITSLASTTGTIWWTERRRGSTTTPRSSSSRVLQVRERIFDSRVKHLLWVLELYYVVDIYSLELSLQFLIVHHGFNSNNIRKFLQKTYRLLFFSLLHLSFIFVLLFFFDKTWGKR